jgi:hypothetical protein
MTSVRFCENLPAEGMQLFQTTNAAALTGFALLVQLDARIGAIGRKRVSFLPESERHKNT